jgi:hypothetical protein
MGQTREGRAVLRNPQSSPEVTAGRGVRQSLQQFSVLFLGPRYRGVS